MLYLYLSVKIKIEKPSSFKAEVVKHLWKYMLHDYDDLDEDYLSDYD